jgi:hypothetical protein
MGCEQVSEAVLDFLLSLHPEGIVTPDSRAVTPFHRLVMNSFVTAPLVKYAITATDEATGNRHSPEIATDEDRAGSCCERTDRTGEAALHMLCRNTGRWSLECLELVFRARPGAALIASVTNNPASKGNSPLHLLCSSPTPRLDRVLTFLKLAAEFGHGTASASAVNARGLTPFMLLVSNNALSSSDVRAACSAFLGADPLAGKYQSILYCSSSISASAVTCSCAASVSDRTGKTVLCHLTAGNFSAVAPSTIEELVRAFLRDFATSDEDRSKSAVPPSTVSPSAKPAPVSFRLAAVSGPTSTPFWPHTPSCPIS